MPSLLLLQCEILANFLNFLLILPINITIYQFNLHFSLNSSIHSSIIYPRKLSSQKSGTISCFFPEKKNLFTPFQNQSICCCCCERKSTSLTVLSVLLLRDDAIVTLLSSVRGVDPTLTPAHPQIKKPAPEVLNEKISRGRLLENRLFLTFPPMISEFFTALH